jgi:hypothetical protein
VPEGDDTAPRRPSWFLAALGVGAGKKGTTNDNRLLRMVPAAPSVEVSPLVVIVFSVAEATDPSELYSVHFDEAVRLVNSPLIVVSPFFCDTEAQPERRAAHVKAVIFLMAPPARLQADLIAVTIPRSPTSWSSAKPDGLKSLSAQSAETGTWISSTYRATALQVSR